jgi:hypothetical protein
VKHFIVQEVTLKDVAADAFTHAFRGCQPLAAVDFL